MDNGFDLPDPVDVNRAQFETVKRGYDAAEVRAYLADVARGLGSYRELVKELERRVATLEDELAEAREAATTDLTEAELTERLGAETARILDAARDAAAERRESVEAEVEQALADAAEKVTAARDHARELVETAETEAAQLVADQIAEADADVAEIRAATQTEVDALVAAAQARAERLVAEGEAARDEALQSGRAMVAEAQVVRERILGDLARRRQSGRRELEQIRAGRDRLLAAFHLAGDELSGLLEELNLALPEARAAAQRAGHSVDLEEVTPEQIEHELEAARLVGHPLVAPSDAVEVSEVDEWSASETVGETVSNEVVEPKDEDEADTVASSLTEIDTAPAALADGDDGENVVLAELGARRSRLTKAGRIAQQLPTGEIPVLKAAPPFEAVRVIDDPTDQSDHDARTEEPTEADAGDVATAVDDGGADAGPVETPGVDEAPIDEPTDGEAIGAPVDDAAEASTDHEAHDAAVDEVEAEEVEELTEESAGDVADEIALGVEEDEAVDEAADEGVDEFEELTEESAGDAADEIALGVEDDDAGEVEAEAVVDDHDDAPGDEVDEAVDALFAKVRAAAEPETDDASAAVATLTRERVTVLDDDPIAGRDRVTESIERAVARALKRSLADDQNELLDAARQTRSFASVADLIDEAAHRERYVEPVRADLVEAFHAGATAGGDPAVDTDLAGAEAALETELVARLRRDLDDVIGTGPDDFDDRLRLLARDLRRNRLSETASFAVLTAYNRGFELALARSPRRWMRDDRHECGLDCEANARAGVVPADHRFDGDVTHPPMFPGCRCQLAGAEQ